MNDHPHFDPGDGRVECRTCGKWVHVVIHSCKGVSVTEAAKLRRAQSDDARSQSSGAVMPAWTRHEHARRTTCPGCHFESSEDYPASRAPGCSHDARDEPGQ